MVRFINKFDYVRLQKNQLFSSVQFLIEPTECAVLNQSIPNIPTQTILFIIVSTSLKNFHILLFPSFKNDLIHVQFYDLIVQYADDEEQTKIEQLFTLQL